jgi:hypothetical protein
MTLSELYDQKQLSIEEIKALLPRAIVDGSSDDLHALLKQFLLKTNGVFDLDEPLVDSLTPLELLSKSNPDSKFTKQMMLFYAATWDYFVGETPTVENIHNLPQHFSLDQPHANIERFLDVQAEEIAAKNDPSVSAVNAKDNPFFSNWGLCVGLSYRYGYYASRGLAHYYLMTIALLKLWKGTAAQLDKKLLDKELPAILPQARFYKTLRELFEQWTNDISAFHSTNIDALILRPKAGIETQFPMARFDLVKSETEADTQLILIEYRHWNFGSYDTAEQFGEYLTYLTQIPNAYIAYGQNDHKTSISTLEGDGRTIYFDPGDIRDRDNLRKLGELDAYSVEALKDLITQAHSEWEDYPKHRSVLVYRYAGPGHKEPWEQSRIFKELPQTPEAAEAFQEESPNHFTHLHVAVLVQDTKTVVEILAAKKVNILAKDDYERYAIDIAVANAYWEGVELLLAEEEIESFYLSDDKIKHLVKYEREDFILRLIQHKKVSHSLFDIVELSMRDNGTKIIEAVKDLFLQDEEKHLPILFKMIEPLFILREEVSAKELFVWLAQRMSPGALDILLNTSIEYRRFNEKITPLHKAIITENDAYAVFLLEKGADLNVRVEGGYDNGKTARELLVERGKLDLIPEDEREWDEKLQIKFRNTFLFFAVGIRGAESHAQGMIGAMASNRNSCR